MGKKSAAARSSAAADPELEKAKKMDPYGWEQYSGEGPIFWMRQLAGLFIVILGSLILASSYSEEHWYLPIDPKYGAYVSLVTIALGALVHEFRPWKVRSHIRMLPECAVILDKPA
jgi:hypothetical protein